jgi:hypothetical protein
VTTGLPGLGRLTLAGALVLPFRSLRLGELER